MGRREQDALYQQAIAGHAAMIRRLACGYEADPDRRRDLLQDIHLDLWRSMELFDGRCALRTWVYRIAHNVAASHIVRHRRSAHRLVDVEALDTEPASVDGEAQAKHRHAARKLPGLIHQLRPADR
ncbi:MAG TPA: sigma factor [Bryobacteraceae bacterium]|nr:sigma factor [Bryobacteraceae bacterium]